MTEKYGVRPGFQIKGDPQKIGEELDSLEKQHGGLKRDMVWKEAQKEDSSLHQEFTWSVVEAAEKCWNHEAGYVMNAITVITYRVDGSDRKEVAFRALYGVPDDINKPFAGVTYFTRDRVMENNVMRQSVIQAAKAYLKAGRDKYRELQELNRIWSEIDKITINDDSEENNTTRTTEQIGL